ncbi:sialate O-acetylesterase [Actomonas aquatica]|uniref:Sialate O-acetylesterase n=1 Tax=Actomonas aquatica TaxID=2866162 RepID=A0ABZ1CA81_9BACT|nr:sialate O-acetylesterase [Opitutus sp. WL0086]WRQ88280.1 sialate O-acetylesterase [Opitutus sp. WL0086]
MFRPRLPLAALTTCLLFNLAVQSAFAALEPARLFTDHMVLQRDQPAPVWGTADPGATITVTFADQTLTTTTDAEGHWRVTLSPLATASTGRDLDITATNRESKIENRKYDDVVVGEVWFCSGQSNMEKPVGPRKGQKPTDLHELTIATAHEPRLRFFNVPRSDQKQDHPAKLRWLVSTPDALRDSQLSAAAYTFGRDLAAALGDVPVGIIHSSFGGTRIEAWMPASAFDLDPTITAARDLTYQAWVPGTQPTELYASMVAPYAGYALRGFLWYQGETNLMSADVELYAPKLRALITAWRTAWHQPEAAFYSALLAPFNYSDWDSFPAKVTPAALPAFWEMQQAGLDLPHTDFISTTDLVANRHDIHPPNKTDVGHRFALLALAHDYGFNALTAHGPRYASHTVAEDGTVTVTFTDSAGLHRHDGQPARGFELAGADQVFHPAEASTEDGKVLLKAAEVPAPVAIRYGWDELADPNLYNSAGLPAVPFRTDTWPVQIER